MEFAAWEWILLVLAALSFGFSKTGMPGASLLAVSVLPNLMPAKVATGVVLPLLIFADLFACLVYRRNLQWRRVGRLMPWALVGIVAGWLALGRVDDTGAGRMIGALIIAMLALHYWRSRTLSEEELAKVPSWFAPMIGLVAGFTTMVANAAGPVMVLYLLAMRLSKLEFLGVAAAFFLIINWVKVPFAVQLGLITPDSLALNLWLLAPVAIGALVGRWVIARIDQHAFENITFALAVLASVKLLMGT
jgi:Predicted permeases